MTRVLRDPPVPVHSARAPLPTRWAGIIARGIVSARRLTFVAAAAWTLAAAGCASQEQTAVATLREAVDAARAGDLDRAADLARRARVERPGFVDALFLLAAVDAKRGDFDAARISYREILVDDPTSTAAAVALAQTYIAESRFDEGEDWLLSAIEEDPGAEAAAFNLGALAEQRQDLDRAASWFELSSSLDLRDPRSMTRIARIRLSQGRTADALRAAEAAVDRAPDYAPGRATLDAARRASQR